MKARIEDDGQIKIYNEIPSQFRGVTGNYIGGFQLADPVIHKEEGFFDVIIPEYNHVLEILGPIYFDEENKFFTYKAETNPNLPTLEQAKIDKIAELKNNGREKFAETDWYYTRELRMKELGITKEVPPEIVAKTRDLYNLLDEREKEINALKDLESVLTFSASLEESQDITPKEEVKEPLPNTDVDLSAYTVALLAVKKEDYTSTSWSVYQSVLDANIMTASNTQEEVDIAVANIKTAQGNLEVLDKKPEATLSSSADQASPSSSPLPDSTVGLKAEPTPVDVPPPASVVESTPLTETSTTPTSTPESAVSSSDSLVS